MDKKILLALGCSFTDEHFYSLDSNIPDDKKGPWAMWPELMGKELNLDVVNFGSGAASNDFIFNKAIQGIAIYGDKIDTLAVLFTSIDRCSYFNTNINVSPLHILAGANGLIEKQKDLLGYDWEKEIGAYDATLKYFQSEYCKLRSFEQMISNFFGKVLALVDICNANNIKLVMNQGVEPWRFWITDKLKEGETFKNKDNIATELYLCKALLHNPIFTRLNAYSDKFVGWPIFTALNGSSYSSRYQDRKDLEVSDRDPHPNKNGQQILANEFLQKYYELYFK